MWLPRNEPRAGNRWTVLPAKHDYHERNMRRRDLPDHPQSGNPNEGNQVNIAETERSAMKRHCFEFLFHFDDAVAYVKAQLI